MKKLFVRVGTIVELTNEQFKKLQNGKMSNDEMLELIKKGNIEGDSYFPFEQYDEKTNDIYELNDEFEFYF